MRVLGWRRMNNTKRRDKHIWISGHISQSHAQVGAFSGALGESVFLLLVSEGSALARVHIVIVVGQLRLFQNVKCPLLGSF